MEATSRADRSGPGHDARSAGQCGKAGQARPRRPERPEVCRVVDRLPNLGRIVSHNFPAQCWSRLFGARGLSLGLTPSLRAAVSVSRTLFFFFFFFLFLQGDDGSPSSPVIGPRRTPVTRQEAGAICRASWGPVAQTLAALPKAAISRLPAFFHRFPFRAIASSISSSEATIARSILFAQAANVFDLAPSGSSFSTAKTK